MEDTRPKFLDSVTEHPDVQRLIKQMVRGNCQNKKLQAENAKLKERIKGLENRPASVECPKCNIRIKTV